MNPECSARWTVTQCLNRVADIYGFWSLDGYHAFYPAEACFVDLAEEFGMTRWGDLECDPYWPDGGSDALRAYKFCMPDTAAYDTYYNREGCSQTFKVGTGRVQPDRVVFGPTGDDEQNSIDVQPIAYNPWASEDKLRIELQGENAWGVYVHGEGLCTDFEVDCGAAHEPFTRARLADALTNGETTLDLACRPVFLQRRTHECRVCEAPNSCRCFADVAWTATQADEEAAMNFTVDAMGNGVYTLDCSQERIAFNGWDAAAGQAAGTTIKSIVVPDGCASDVLLYVDPEEHTVFLEGAIAGSLEILFGRPPTDLTSMPVQFSPGTLWHTDMAVDMSWTELATGILGRDMHEEDRLTFHTFSVPDDPLTVADDATTSYVLSACREACSDNTHAKARTCKDFGVVTTEAGAAERDFVQRGAEDTGTVAVPNKVLGDGDDVAIGGPGDDVIAGGDGDDTLDGGAGTDVLLGGDGADTLISRGGYDLLVGGEGCDRYRVYPTHDHDHHREEGCTQIAGTTEDETIELRTADDRCVLEIGVWELTMYMNGFADPTATWKWDVWLTEEGEASICLGDDVQDAYTECGRVATGLCFDWDVCPGARDDFSLIDYEANEDTLEWLEGFSAASWFAPWTNLGGGAVPSENTLDYPGRDPNAGLPGYSWYDGGNQCLLNNLSGPTREDCCANAPELCSTTTTWLASQGMCRVATRPADDAGNAFGSLIAALSSTTADAGPCCDEGLRTGDADLTALCNTEVTYAWAVDTCTATTQILNSAGTTMDPAAPAATMAEVDSSLCCQAVLDAWPPMDFADAAACTMYTASTWDADTMVCSTYDAF